MVKKMNDMLTKDSMTILPLVDRGRVSGEANTLGGRRDEHLGQRAVERCRLVPQEVTDLRAPAGPGRAPLVPLRTTTNQDR